MKTLKMYCVNKNNFVVKNEKDKVLINIDINEMDNFFILLSGFKLLLNCKYVSGKKSKTVNNVLDDEFGYWSIYPVSNENNEHTFGFGKYVKLEFDYGKVEGSKNATTILKVNYNDDLSADSINILYDKYSINTRHFSN